MHEPPGSEQGARLAWPAVGAELWRHVPFTFFGTLTGLAVLALFAAAGLSRETAAGLFGSLHPVHVLLSALATTALYRRYARGGWPMSLLVGYAGAVGIASISDCVIPYVGEWLAGLPNRGVHLGFIEHWWLVNPMAAAGVGLAWLLPFPRISHGGHVLVSTWASALHMQMARGDHVGGPELLIVPAFLFLAVWGPCCTSDIVFPMLCAARPRPSALWRAHRRSQ
jgi:hypothetical protein